MKFKPDLIGVAIQGFGALLVSLTLVLTSCQIRAARRSLQATTVYNLERDFSDRFSRTTDAVFKSCFGVRPSPSPDFGRDDNCQDSSARADFLDLLAFYRLLLDLEDYDAVDREYVDLRIRAACDIFSTAGSLSTINDFKRKGLVQDRVAQRIHEICSASR
jgi:hypothetical protein